MSKVLLKVLGRQLIGTAVKISRHPSHRPCVAVDCGFGFSSALQCPKMLRIQHVKTDLLACFHIPSPRVTHPGLGTQEKVRVLLRGCLGSGCSCRVAAWFNPSIERTFQTPQEVLRSRLEEPRPTSNQDTPTRTPVPRVKSLASSTRLSCQFLKPSIMPPIKSFRRTTVSPLG